MASWLAQNWLDLVQTTGVVGSLFFAGFALRLDTKVRRTEVLLSLTEAHRDIWEKLIEQPTLDRVRDPEANIHAEPPTPAERRFVQLVILHVATVRQAIRERAYEPSPGMDEDIRQFLSLPIPRLVASAMLPYQAPDFQEYLHALMER